MCINMQINFKIHRSTHPDDFASAHTVQDAICKLLPEFAQRMKMRNILTTIHEDMTYFATIPLDICDIIRDFVPDLRQSYDESTLQRIKAQYDTFITKFGSDNPIKNPFKSDTLSWQKIIRDYPQFSDLQYDAITYFYAKATPALTYECDEVTFYPDSAYYYYGKNRYITHEQDKQLNNTRYPLYYVNNDYGSYLLPCGLIMYNIIDDNPEYGYKKFLADLASNPNLVYVQKVDYFLFNVETGEYVKIIMGLPLNKSLLIDDYGTILPYSKGFRKAVSFSNADIGNAAFYLDKS